MDLIHTVEAPKLIYTVSKLLAITGKKINIAFDQVSVSIIILDYKK